MHALIQSAAALRQILEEKHRGLDPKQHDPDLAKMVVIGHSQGGLLTKIARNWVASLFCRFASLPANIIKGASSYLTMENTLKLPFHLKGGMPTSIDGMSPRNPILLELAEMPIVPGVTAHSIIAIKDDGNSKDGYDGVVEYRSAHLPGVASEFIVQSEHSCRQYPLTIEGVRRMLFEHQATMGWQVFGKPVAP